MAEFQLDHVAVAVHSTKDALRLFRNTLGGDYLMGGNSGSWSWNQVRFPGGGKVELLEPKAEGFLSRFLDSHGEGLHHVTFKTDDIGGAIGDIQAAGYELIDVNIDDPNWKEAFFRPSKTFGTLIQVAQSAAPDEVVKEFLQPSDRDELLA